MPTPNPSALSLLLLSGGIESAALLYRLRHLEEPVHALWVDYGQRNARRERAAAASLSEACGAPLQTMDLSGLRDHFTRASEWVSHVPLPQRNLAVLALAVNLAQHLGARRILLALNRDDRNHGPGSQPAFLHAFANLAGTLVPGMEVLAPLHHLDKAEVIRTAAPTGIDWTRTWSCLLDPPQHCGRCPQCEARHAAFAAAGIADPTDYGHPPNSGDR
ncbi:MAG: 7-cyano-7-deazaguanine synthase [Thioalkalivibrio sp.]|nr:7-cyano-7-deazaguanine synthase [Thioalkalivibrio sp.]